MCGLLADRWRMFDKAAARSSWSAWAAWSYREALTNWYIAASDKLVDLLSATAPEGER